jgi:hypothetical protein
MTGVPFLTYTPASFTSSSGLTSQARRSSKNAEAELLAALRRLRLQMNVVEDFECRHGIDQRWEVSDPRYHQAREYSGQRHFVRVVEELEGLVVQRMFELSKANLSGTGIFICLIIVSISSLHQDTRCANIYLKLSHDDLELSEQHLKSTTPWRRSKFHHALLLIMLTS